MRVLWTRLTFYLIVAISLGLGTLAWLAGHSLDQAALKASIALLTFGVVGWMLNLLVLGSSLNTPDAQSAPFGNERAPANSETAKEGIDDAGEETGNGAEGEQEEEVVGASAGEPV